jgi:hypothetical protein
MGSWVRNSMAGVMQQRRRNVCMWQAGCSLSCIPAFVETEKRFAPLRVSIDWYSDAEIHHCRNWEAKAATYLIARGVRSAAI